MRWGTELRERSAVAAPPGCARSRLRATSGVSGDLPLAAMVRGLTMAAFRTAAMTTVYAAAALLAPFLGARAAIAQSVDADAWNAAISRFEQKMEAQVAADDVGGVSAAVARGSDVVWARAFGWADRDRRIPAGVGSIYRVGSISKTVTAVVMMRAVERGYIDLDQPLSEVFPATARFPGAMAGAPAPTVRQFASHTSGLVREPDWDIAAAGPIGIWEERVVASIPLSRFQNAPGAEYSYSNIGYGTLGLAVARAAGRPFMEFVEEDVFEPLGMSSSTFVIGPELAPRLTVGYVNRGDGDPDPEQPTREHAGRGYKVPNGGVYSTVGDLARFMGALQGRASPAILSDESVAEMSRVHTPEDPDNGYGLGLMVRTTGGGARLVGHSGSVAGYNAYMLFEPESGLGVVLLRNYNQGEASLGAAGQELLEELLGALR